MKFMGWIIFAATGLAAAACGSHGDYAPITYGADTARQAQIYNSPSAAGQAQQAAPRAIPASTTEVETAGLRPVSAVYLTEPGEIETLRMPASANAVMITVRRGDTVYAIGRRYDVSPQAIIAENNLSAPYLLSVGQTLRLPAASAPAAQAAPARKVVARDRLYRVEAGDTLYSLSRRWDVAPRVIAQANGLTPPYALGVGQQLLIPKARVTDDVYAAAPQRSAPQQAQPKQQATREPQNVADLAKSVSYATPPQPEPLRLFDWPVRGKIVAGYGAGEGGRRNDGVNIAAPAGTPVRAAADGEVVYRGAELDGFGNLLLVKHADGFVTAYAHNDAMLVKKGQTVRQGQVIAKVGQTGAVTTPQLHFEIRQNLKSVDPIALLGAQ